MPIQVWLSLACVPACATDRQLVNWSEGFTSEGLPLCFQSTKLTKQTLLINKTNDAVAGVCRRPSCECLAAIAQVAPFRKLRQEKSEQGKGKVTDFIKYDIRQMHTAFTGTIPFSREEEDVLVGPSFARPQCCRLTFPVPVFCTYFFRIPCPTKDCLLLRGSAEERQVPDNT